MKLAKFFCLKCLGRDVNDAFQAERRRRLEEEERKLSELKPAQALFERARGARAKTGEDAHVSSSSSDANRLNVSRGAVEDVKKKLNRKSRNLEEELMELLEAEKSRQMAAEEVGKRRAEPEAVQGGYSIASPFVLSVS